MFSISKFSNGHNSLILNVGEDMLLILFSAHLTTLVFVQSFMTDRVITIGPLAGS